MAFLDNIKISVKTIGGVLLLAIVSARLIVFSGMTLNQMDTSSRNFWRAMPSPASSWRG